MVRAFRRLCEALITGGAPLGSLAALVALSSVPTACGSELEGRAPLPDLADTVDATDTADTSDTFEDTRPDGDTTGDTGPDPDTGDTTSDTSGDSSDVDTYVPPAEWQTLSVGDLGRIDGLVLASAELGFATSGARVLRWDGRLWAAFGEPGAVSEATSGRAVYGVAVSGDEVWAVGEAGLVARRPTDGTAGWELIESGLTVNLRAVGARGDAVFVAGDDGTLASFDGAAWTTHFTRDVIDLYAMWVDAKKSGEDGVYAVGSGGQLVWRDGSTWKSTQVAANTVTLRDILGLADGTLVAVGNQHTITARRVQTGNWVGQASNDTRERDLAGLALSKDGTLRAFGADGAVLVQDGTVWSVDTAAGVAAGLKDFLVAEAVPGSSAVMALAQDGGGVRFDGTTWTAIATSPESSLTDLASASADTLWLTGNKGLLMRRDAAGWTTVPTGVATDLNAVAVDPDDADSVFAVGDAGAIVHLVDGEPTVIAAPVPLDLFAVAVSGGKAWAAGRGGTLLVIELDTRAGGGQATVRASGTTADLKALARGGDGALWAAGSFGTLLRVPATGLPTAVLSGVGGSLNDLAPTSDGVLAVGDNGVVLRATATGAVLENEEPGRFLYAVATAPTDPDGLGRALAVGANGAILRFEDQGWVSEVPAERAATFEAVWIGLDGEALIGGIHRVHHLESRLRKIE